MVFCPTSDPKAAVNGGSKDMTTWTEWDPKSVINAFDKTEATVRGFGGGAAQSPIFIPELQGGWFNHYTVSCTFDDVYNYYGEDFTKMVVETAMSQGCTALNLYMFYGGTNWGTLGDPDVYTSYDYSACLREFGHIAKKTRLVRLAFSFARSFAAELLKTEPSELSVRSSYLVESSMSDFIAKQRTTVGPSRVHFIFYRNFNPKKPVSSTITLSRNHRESVQLGCKLGYKESFVGLANYSTSNGLLLALSTLPIHLKTLSPSGQEIWFIQCDAQKNGQLAFQGGIEIENGTLGPVFVKEDDLSVVSFKANSGWCKIQQIGKPSTALYLIALTGSDLLSLQPIFREEYWSGKSSTYPLAVFWGAYQFDFDFEKRDLTIHRSSESAPVFAVSSSALGPLEGFTQASGYTSFVLERKEVKQFVLPPALPVLRFDEIKQIDLKRLQWQPVPLLPNSTRPSETPIDLCFTSGQVVYKLVFQLTTVPNEGLKFDINMRHRVAILLNNKSIGGHMTYSLGTLRPGSKNGPDIGNMAGWKKYSLPASELLAGENEIYCVVESLGLNRAPGPIDDIRSPRGLMDAKIEGAVGRLTWFISGVDVRNLSQVFNHCGIPEEGQPWTPIGGEGLLQIPKGVVVPTWYKSKFSYDLSPAVNAPLRLSISGSNMAYIYVNETFIGRYYGLNQGPQHDFYVPAGLVKATNSFAILTFGIGEETNLNIAFKRWKFASDSSLICGSGNINEDGREFVLNTSTIVLSQ